jgi:hypothetical protein
LELFQLIGSLGKGGAAKRGCFVSALSLFTLLLIPPVPAQEGGRARETWYISNAGGMALRPAPSRLAALRNQYSLMIGRAAPQDLPDSLRTYYQSPWAIEVRVLYNQGAESRRQWIFLEGERTRLVAVFVEPPAPDEAADGENPAPPEDGADGEGENGEAETPASLFGFIELYNGEGFLAEERRFQDDGEEIGVKYFFNRRTLIRAETTRKVPPDSETEAPPDGEEAAEPEETGEEMAEEAGEEAAETGEDAELPPADPVEQLVCTDYYRYSRSGSLRAIERVYHETPPEGAVTQLRFPQRILDSVYDKEFVNPALAYGSEFLSDIFIDSGYRVVYNTDQRGRILSETRFDSKGDLVGEIKNTWTGERLTEITWKAGEDERRVVYSYNAEGDRTEERNYRKGNLERLVLREGDIEVEELYMDGQPILRARWEKGRKVSEERIPPSGSGRDR